LKSFVLLHEFLSCMLIVGILICVCLNRIYVLLTKLCCILRIRAYFNECFCLEFGPLY
jgi:maltodextrin utilization protein YvdJ